MNLSRGSAWLLAVLVLTPVVLWRTVYLPPSVEPLPVLYTLGGDFELESTLGGRLRLSDLAGDLVLLNFGYTGCPDVCPTALARMRDVLRMLPDAPADIRPLFVTLDPSVDTVDRIGPYLHFFDPSFVGLTGTESQIEAAAENFKVFFERTEMASEAGYSISHSSHIYLLDTQGRVRATFGEGIPVGEIAATVQNLSQESATLAWSLRRDG